MAIITSIEVFKKYVNVSGTLNIDTIKPFVNDAQQAYLKEFLGETLLDELDAFRASISNVPAWDGATSQEVATRLNNLLPYVECALAKFSLFMASPFMDLKVTDSGFGVINNQGVSPASSDRVARFTQATLKAGYDNVETMLRFLEKYKSQYPSWVAGEGYTIYHKYFINSAEEFNKHVNIDNSRLKFRQMLVTMENVELLQIEPVISPELAEAIRTEAKEGDLSADNLKLILYIRKACANLTYYAFGLDADDLPNSAVIAVEQARMETYLRNGNFYLAEIKKVLDANPDKYPLYAASAVYDAAKTSNAFFENTDSASFVFGG